MINERKEEILSQKKADNKSHTSETRQSTIHSFILIIIKILVKLK